MKTEVEKTPAISENNLFRAAFDYASIGMALVSPVGECLEVNNSICQITGYTREELLKQTFLDITHPDDVEKDRLMSRQVLNGLIDHFEMEKRYFHKDGQIVWVLLTVSAVRDKNNEPVYLIGQVKDITERKQFEGRLIKREKELETVLNNTKTVITRFNRDFRHLYVNNTIEEEIGIPAAELLGKTFAELNLSNNATAKIEETIRLVFETKETQQIEIKNEITVNEPYYFAHFTPEFNNQGEVEAVLVVSLNVTKLKKIEIELREALANIKQLQEILPICSYCKNIRDDQNYWQTVENYISTYTQTQFSHSICPTCYENVVKPNLLEKGIKSKDHH